ncbi:FAD-binding oxidoreductase [Henriciella aquimarina]|uniref:FAD-binding oxidoreductase n=1 Tax=Henriciella aquimarina TaxID=545261 RepID=UPI0009FD539C|nr:FAD-binding oxidoreductase [Henriciella aquimarina]
MPHTLTLQSIETVTHDVNRYRFDKPSGLAYTPGQAFDIGLDRDGWRDDKHPFTPTSLPDEGFLEFTIKTYVEHDGLTKRLADLKPGDTVLADEPWGAIHDQGPGWFIAGGAGVTPFIAILRQRLAREGTLEGSELIFSNKTEDDIILRDAFEKMPGLSTYFTVTDQKDASVHTGQIDRDLLAARITPGKGKCYVCGPDAMLDDISGALLDIGVPESDIITEEFD